LKKSISTFKLFAVVFLWAGSGEGASVLKFPWNQKNEKVNKITEIFVDLDCRHTVTGTKENTHYSLVYKFKIGSIGNCMLYAMY